MTTLLDILDTAVKIGLGVLITAVSTHLLNKRKHTHEIRKMRLQESTRWLRECMSKLETASTLLNEIMLQSVANQKSLDILLTAFNQVKDARSICYLLGHKEIGDLVSKYASEINELKKQCVLGKPWDDASVDANGDRRGALKSSILDKLADAYKATYS